MVQKVLEVNRMRSSGVSVGSGEDTPEGFGAETSVQERAENLQAAEAAGAGSLFEAPREVRREEPSLTQPRPPPMAGFGANRPETELGPEVEKLMDDVFQKVKAELRQGFEESRRLRPENRPEGPDDRARGASCSITSTGCSSFTQRPRRYFSCPKEATRLVAEPNKDRRNGLSDRRKSS